MSKVPQGVDPQQLTIVTRKVLLDALQILAGHADAVTIIGAQAVYLRTTDVRLAVATFTSDADLGLNPTELTDIPLLNEAMQAAGFAVTRREMPGTWVRDETIDGTVVPIPVDLLVAESLASGRRGADIPPHSYDSTRRVSGIEAAVVDRDLLDVISLDPATDLRAIQAYVAGPAALFVAKAHKITERARERDRRPDRLIDKDAGDIARLTRSDAGDPADVAERVRRLQADQRTAESANTGLRYLHNLFGTSRALGVEMAIRALGSEAYESLLPGYFAELRRELGDAWPAT